MDSVSGVRFSVELFEDYVLRSDTLDACEKLVCGFNVRFLCLGIIGNEVFIESWSIWMSVRVW